MLTYLAINLMFPGPFFIYAVGFGWVFYIFLLPVDIVISVILSLIVSIVFKNNWSTAKFRTILGIFSIALNFACVGILLAIAGIIWFIADIKNIEDDLETKFFNFLGLGLSCVSVLMTILWNV